MEKIIFRRADKNDINSIQQLAEKIWNAHYSGIISVEQISYMLEEMYSAESLASQMESGHEFFMAFVNEEPAGFMSMQKRSTGNYFLPKFYIDTEIHRKGIGSALFDYVIRETGNPVEIELTVNRKNYKAINFYFKNGFIIDHIADFDIGNGYFMHDFVMKRKLKGSQVSRL